MDSEQAAANIIKRFDTAEGKRSNWESHWEEIARRILPSYAESFQKQGQYTTTGDKRTEEMFDATGALALPKFAAAVEFMTTPRGSTWHHLMPMDPVLRKNRGARLWFDEANAALFKYRYAPRANFSSQNHESNISLGAFGTGPMFVDALEARYGGGLRYKALHLSGLMFFENHQGMIDTCLRKYCLTARQAVAKFTPKDNTASDGKEKYVLPEDILNAAKRPETSEKEFFFIHCVRPREDDDGYDPKRLDEKGMPYISHHVSVTGKAMVAESGYDTFPFPVSRYVVAPGETYGRSPAMMALPSLKTLNEQKKTMLKQGHRAVDPVLLTHDDDILDGFSFRPGAMNPGGVTAEGRALVHALPVGNLALGKDMMDEEKMVIQDAFLLTLFQILIETPQMTATEVLERTREKGILLSPTMGRQQTEKLGPMIERELDVLSQQGKLPPMPEIVAQALAEYEVIYDSPMSRAQRAEEAAGLMRTIDWTRGYVQVSGDPTPLDHFDWDQIMPDLADIQAVPTKWMRDADTIAGIRQGRQQQQQQQQMLDAAPALAGAAKALPEGALSGGQ